MISNKNEAEDIDHIDHLIYSYSHYDNGGSKHKTLAFIDGMLEIAIRFNLSISVINRLREKRNYIEELDKF